MFRLALFAYITRGWYLLISAIVSGTVAMATVGAVMVMMHYLFAGL